MLSQHAGGRTVEDRELARKQYELSKAYEDNTTSTTVASHNDNSTGLSGRESLFFISQ